MITYKSDHIKTCQETFINMITNEQYLN